MIIKGSARGQTQQDANRLARHLLSDENEAVRLLSLDGIAATNLADAVDEMRMLSLGTRARHGLYHASINLDSREAARMDCRRWRECVDELAHHLGMAGHPRAVVMHRKRGREHVHVVFSRVHPVTLKVARDSHNYRAHEVTSRALEARFGLRRVDGVFSRAPGARRPVAKATHGDWQAQERTGIKVDDVGAALRRAWGSTETGCAFAAAIRAEGLCLARGRRGIIVVDAAGTPHSLPRRLGLKAAEVRKRLVGIDIATVPTVELVKKSGRIPMSKPRHLGASSRKSDRQQAPMPLPSADYWRKLGYAVEEFPEHLAVMLSPTTRLLDHGNRLILDRADEPTDEEIRVLVATGRERGWTEIRFFGGSPDFQRRARLEALRQGYRLDQISLECEDGLPRPLAAVPMPDHIKRRLVPPTEPETIPVAPIPDPFPTAPAPGLRP